MASTRQLKNRIRSVKSTKQITKAMQMVAASKMRRAQDATKASSPYTKSANELLTYLASQGLTNEHPFFAKRPINTRLLVLVASDKGLAGAYNNNVIKLYLDELKRSEADGVKNITMTIGRKASIFVSRLKDVTVVGSYDDLPDYPRGNAFYSIIDSLRDLFVNGTVDAVDVIYTDFVSGITQVPTIKKVLPAGYTKVPVSEFVKEAKYEPDLLSILDGVAYRLIGAQLFQTLLDAKASEHSMRMIAMKNATDNASELVDDLTLAMNKARQGAITQELSEISAGAEAMK